MNAKELFWQIVNCPWSNPLSECSTILAEQKELSTRQVPEPWSGDLMNASFLMIGANPALNPKEVFPSRFGDGAWAGRCAKGYPWHAKDVEDFFKGRFAGASCKCCQQDRYYVRTSGGVSVLERTASSCKYDRAQNGYWAAYCKYSSAIHRRADGEDANSPQLGHDIVVTDMVHCKGGGERGVPKAMIPCSRHMRGIVESFARNNSKDPHSILIFGSDQRDKKVRAFIDFLKRYGKFSFIGTVGTFPHKEGKNLPLEYVNEWRFELTDGAILQVFTNLPKPSAANRAKMAVHFLDTEITW